ncbi:MAG: glycosyltransferase [Propioniciclava sp.]
MKILLAVLGSTGDIAPFTGVAHVLRSRGHQVTMTAQADVAPVVRRAGIPCAVLPGRARMVAGITPRPGLRGQLKMLSWLGDQAVETAGLLLRALHPLIADQDAVVFSPLTLVALSVAERYQVPSLGVHLQPLVATRAFPPAMLPIRSLGGALNHALGELFLDVTPRRQWPAVRRLRADLGLPPLGNPRQYRLDYMRGTWPLLQAYSRHVVPPPPDNPPSTRTVGYCWPAPATGWTPPSDLVAFLEAGPAPIVVSFGSAPVGDTNQMRTLLESAGRRTSERLVIQAGWAGLGDPGPLSDSVYRAGSLPHAWLFPRAGAVVHACGAGTTAAVLRAGVPAIPVPVMMDQPFWARRQHQLGIAPAPMPVTQLTEARLVEAIRSVRADPSMAVRAQAMAAAIADEDGNGAVADAVEALTS